MPELPEVETIRCGIAPLLEGCVIQQVIVREPRLRWFIADDFSIQLTGQQIQHIQRRGKYLLFICTSGCLLVHLGMSGRLQLVSPNKPLEKHDHVDLVFSNDLCLRYHDPRRFGCLIWTSEPPFQHPLLAKLGIEPLGTDFTAAYLYQFAQKRDKSIKALMMDNHIVVGVGNIYANESLFLAGIHPARSVKEISLQGYHQLVIAIKSVLTHAIALGGTTLRDFTDSSGNAGYFKQMLKVYGRAGKICISCGMATIQQQRLGQRASYFCPRCQK